MSAPMGPGGSSARESHCFDISATYLRDLLEVCLSREDDQVLLDASATCLGCSLLLPGLTYLAIAPRLCIPPV